MNLGKKKYDFAEMSIIRVLGVVGVLLLMVVILYLLTPQISHETLTGNRLVSPGLRFNLPLISTFLAQIRHLSIL